MADEITYQTSLTVEKGNIKLERKPETIYIDWSGADYFQATQTVSNVYSVLSYTLVDNISSFGLFWVRNTGTEDAYISFDSGVTTTLVIKPEEYFTWRLYPTIAIDNLMTKANVTSTTIEYVLIED